MNLDQIISKYETELKTLKLQNSDEVLIISFNRPDKLNAISSEMQHEIINLFKDLHKELPGNAVVLTGEGRAFMAGADISEYGRDNIEEFIEFQRIGMRMYDSIRNSRLIVISAVNGYALGGGLEMAIATDIIFASVEAKLGLPEVKLGLLPGGGATTYLQSALSEQTLKYLLISGKSLTAQECLRFGVIQEIHENDVLLKESVALASKINSYSTDAVTRAKKFLNKSYHPDLKDKLEIEHKNLIELFDSEDGQEGISAFLEKRPAKFRGTNA
jgi:enoyl-CoA hydratase